MMKKRFLAALASILCCAQFSLFTQASEDADALLDGLAFVTHDIDASVEFYTKFLGFREYKRVQISSPASLSTFGVSADKAFEYAAMVPKTWTKEGPHRSALNFIEINEADPGSLKQESNRRPIASEVVKAYSVTGLVEIEQQMRAAGVTIVVPLAQSATGKSTALTVLDPNGVRVQLYEYN